ncbi:MAG: hypothetical protein Alpg2KO_18780 [Alphaproteobacteria bacterium]
MDRKRVNPDQPVTFDVVGPPFDLPDLEDVTSVAAICRDDDGQMLVVQTGRGPDLPGGHMEVGETRFEQTAKREALEEGLVDIDHLHVACLIRVTPSDPIASDRAEPTSWMVIMSGRVTHLHPEQPGGDFVGREFMTPEAFLQVYQGDQDLMAAILGHAA